MAGHGAAAFRLNDFIEMRDITDLVVRRETSDPRRDRVRSSMIETGLNGEREWAQVRGGVEETEGREEHEARPNRDQQRARAGAF